MTVSSDKSREDYEGTGSNTYPYRFKIFAKTDLKVWVDGEPRAVDVHYTVTNVGEPEGGNVVFGASYIPANGAEIAIIRDLPLTQLIDYTEGDKFPAETHEAGLDRLVMLAQRVYEQVRKTLRIPIYSTVEDVFVEIRADGFLKWNSDGDSIIAVPEWEAGDPLPEHSDLHENGGGDEISIDGLSGMPADLATHAERHQAEGEDAIKLDDLDEPDDNTDLNVSIEGHGLCPKAPDDAAKVLRGGDPPAFAYEKIIQVVNSQTGAVATGTTLIPYDDTIPQITEGNQYMTLTITPKNANSKLKIDVIVFLANSVDNYLVAALFQNAVANALACGFIYEAANIPGVIPFTHFMTAGGTEEITFRVRCGGHSAGTTTLNGTVGARKYGGVLASSITITEIAA